MSKQETGDRDRGERRIDWRQVWSDVWGFLKVVLIIVAIVLSGVGVSFFFWGELSARAFSDRLAYAGMGAVVVGGFAAVASLNAYSTLGTPSVFTAGSDSRIATERVADYFRTNAKRYGFVLRMLAVAIICLALSALIDILGG